MFGRNRFSITANLVAQLTLGLSIAMNALALHQWRQLQDMPVGKWETGTVVGVEPIAIHIDGTG